MLINQLFLTIYYLRLQNCSFKATVHADDLDLSLAKEILHYQELSLLKHLKQQQIGRAAPTQLVSKGLRLHGTYSSALEATWTV